MKIVLPVGGDPSAVAAADYVIRQWSNRALPIEVTVLGVTTEDDRQHTARDDPHADQSRRIATIVSRHLRRAGFDHDYRRLSGTPAEAVARYAFEMNADLIVVARQPRSAMSRAMLFVAHMSTATEMDRLIEITPCPVLVVVYQRTLDDSEPTSPANRPH